MDSLTIGGFGALTILLVSSACFLITAGHFYYRNLFNYWSKRGIKGPKPIPLFGNFHLRLLNDILKLHKDLVQKYGKVYGVFLGGTPQLVVADAEVMVKICIKDFDSFTNHVPSEFFNEFQKSFIFSALDEDWKRLRALTSPTFTSGKIKRMFRLLDKCADDLIQCFSQQLSEQPSIKQQVIGFVDVKDTYSLYTLDAISSCCYGMKMERCGATDIKMAASKNELINLVLNIFKFSIVRISILFLAPKFMLRLIKYEMFPKSQILPLADKMTKVIEARRKSKSSKFDDYLQMLIDARIDDEFELNDMDLKEDHHAGLNSEYLAEERKRMINELETTQNLRSKIELSDLEILTGAMFLMIVGLHTTSSLLTHCSFALAFHPDIQERLYNELRALAKWDETKKRSTFDYNSITSCQYLDAVVSETLRMFTPALETDRVAKFDYLIEKYNLVVPKGSKIILALFALQNDPDYWENPENFDPERFMPNNRCKIIPGTYCPFGIGPRHCVGMRFSLTSAKLALAKVLTNFRFEPAPGTVFPPKASNSNGFFEIANPKVTTIKRDRN